MASHSKQPSGKPKSPKRDYDWEAIEREYRAGHLSVREIGKIHGLSHTAIQKRAKLHGWTQNLTKRVREAVATKLVASDVATTEKNAEKAVEEVATRITQIVREHRRDIFEARQMVSTLVVELKESTVHRDDIEEAIENHKGARRRDRMLRAVNLSSRASVIVNLSSAMKNLIALERQAFSLDNPSDGGSAPTDPLQITDEMRAKALANFIARTKKV